MRQIFILLTTIGLLFSCISSEKNNVSTETNTLIPSTKKNRQILIEELNRLKSVLASNDEKEIADIFSFPMSNEEISIFIDNNSFNEQLEKNDNKITKTMFIDFFKEISENLQMDEINLLFKKINLSELQKKDTLENSEIIKTEPCFNFYAVKVEKDIVTLLTGVKSNKDYKSKLLTKDEIPENSSEFCESAVWWTFQFDGKKLKFKYRTGAG